MEFDRIFLGQLTWSVAFEIVLRTGVMYVFTLGLIRLLGKRGLAQLSPFELVIIVALGSAVGDPMIYPEVPLAHGVLVLTVVVSLQTALVKLTEQNRMLERAIESEPVLLVDNGEINEKVLNHEDMSEDELLMSLRQHGVEYLGQVRRAYLEPSGQVSVFLKSGSFDGSGRSILP